MGEIKYITSLVMVVLFAIAIMTFAINFGTDNDAKILLTNDTQLTTVNTDLSGDVKTFQDNVQTSSDGFAESTASPGDDVSTSGEQFKVSGFTIIGMTTSILTTGYEKIFGQDSGFGLFLTATLGLLSFIFLRYAYKSWWGKNPD